MKGVVARGNFLCYGKSRTDFLPFPRPGFIAELQNKAVSSPVLNNELQEHVGI